MSSPKETTSQHFRFVFLDLSAVMFSSCWNLTWIEVPYVICASCKICPLQVWAIPEWLSFHIVGTCGLSCYLELVAMLAVRPGWCGVVAKLHLCQMFTYHGHECHGHIGLSVDKNIHLGLKKTPEFGAQVLIHLVFSKISTGSKLSIHPFTLLIQCCWKVRNVF